jgi:hypothetical protein
MTPYYSSRITLPGGLFRLLEGLQRTAVSRRRFIHGAVRAARLAVAVRGREQARDRLGKGLYSGRLLVMVNDIALKA